MATKEEVEVAASANALEIERLMAAATEALTDGMVERLATTASNGLEIIDQVNNEDTKEAILDVIDKLTQLHKLGAIDTMFEAVLMIHGVRAAMTDSMLERFSMFAEHMLNTVATEEVATIAHTAIEAFEEAAADDASRGGKGGMISTVKLLMKPETQQAMHFILKFACIMRKNALDHFGGEYRD